LEETCLWLTEVAETVSRMESDRPNALAALLATPTTERRATDYERMFDDFVAYAGGGRVMDRFDLPVQVQNADYHFAFSNCELLLELKQISNYKSGDTAEAHFKRLLGRGKVRKHTAISTTQIRIDPESLSLSDWNHFYGKFRPGVTGHLKKAARQLKETDRLLPPPMERPRLCGLLLINTGDYNLPLDLMFRLVEWRTKREWKAGNFSKLHFVSCLTVDLLRRDQHPLKGRHIAHPEPHDLLPGAVQYVYERWLHYYAAAIGAEVTFQPDAALGESPLLLDGAFAGKIRMKHDRRR